MKRLFPIILLLLTACGSSTEPVLYALASRPAAAQPGAPRLVELRRPGIAGYLDRSAIVKKVADYQLKIAGGEQWAEPLGDMIGRVIAQNLATRLAESSVFVENGAISAVPEAIVGVNVLRFDASADGTITLVVQVIVEQGSVPRRTVARSLTFVGTPKSNDTNEQVATMSNLVGDLSDAIAAMLRAV